MPSYSIEGDDDIELSANGLVPQLSWYVLLEDTYILKNRTVNTADINSYNHADGRDKKIVILGSYGQI